jgi:predicted secreted protein
MGRGKQSVRSGIIAALALMLAVVTLAACGGGDDPDRPKAKVVEGTETTDISVKEDQPFVIALESNPSTGFTWTQADRKKFDEDDVVKFIKVTTVAPSGDAVGAPGKQRFRYRGINAGEDEITLNYARPNEPDSPDNQTVTYNITVTG